TGEVGVVVEQNRVRRLRPKVLIVLDGERTELEQLRMLDLAKVPGDPKNKNGVWIIEGHEHGAFGINPRKYFHTDGKFSES
ncbi:MAG: hypothetical protein ACR2P6_02705, partial [Gammaproteobacteria bacterium]